MQILPIMVTWETLSCKTKAESLIHQLETVSGIQLCDSTLSPSESIYRLHVTEQRLELKNDTHSKIHPLSVDFLNEKMIHRLKDGRHRKEQIAKAVGIKGHIRPYVWDTTAGLGRDAYVLATLGCRIHLIERSPILFFLLKDGLERASQNPISCPIIANMQLTLGDASHMLQALNVGDTQLLPDVIYLDPMYPERTKSALPKKEMRIIRALVGQDNDADQLLLVALNKAKHRVVVKRPIKGNPLQGPKPDFAIKGTLNRYDVYLTNL